MLFEVNLIIAIPGLGFDTARPDFDFRSDFFDKPIGCRVQVFGKFFFVKLGTCFGLLQHQLH